MNLISNLIRRIVILFIFINITCLSLAQDQTYIDSLYNELKLSESPARKLELRTDIGEATMAFRIPYWDSIITEAKQLLRIGEMSEIDRISINKTIALCYNNSGFINDMKGLSEKAIVNYSESKKTYETINDERGVSISLNNIGYIYQNRSKIELALDFYEQALKKQIEIKDSNLIAITYNNIAYIYEKLGEIEEALSYYKQSITIHNLMGQEHRTPTPINNVAMIKLRAGNIDEALTDLELGLKIARKNNNHSSTGSTLNNIGLVYNQKGEPNKALEFFVEAKNLQLEANETEELSISYRNIANIYYDKGNLDTAELYALKALKIGENLGFPDKIEIAASLLSEIYSDKNNSDKAFKYLKLHIKMKDSSQSVDNQKAVIRQKYKFSYEKQAAADSIKTVEKNKVKDAQLLAQKAENKQQKQLSFFLYGGLLLVTLFGVFILNRFRISQKQKVIIQNQKLAVDDAFDELEEKNTEILDSISYAKRIQSAILPSNKMIKEHLQNSFILYKPKDVVAGDFYWMEVSNALSKGIEKESQLANQPDKKSMKTVLFAAADCTGHGVPGAMVSVVCNNALNRSVREYGLTDPGEILDKTREIVIQEFEKSEEDVKDGMDIALCSLRFKVQGSKLKKTTSTKNPSTSNLKPQTIASLQFAGAHNPLWIIRNGSNSIEEIKADKEPIGSYDKQSPYTTHTIELQKGDTIYIFSDGYADQFGGEKGKKLKSKGFKNLLLSINGKPIDEQKLLLDKAFTNWHKNLEQIDDVCVIGVRI